MSVAKKKAITAGKALKILQDGRVRGHKLTEKQMKFFGAIAGGEKPKKKRSSKR